MTNTIKRKRAALALCAIMLLSLIFSATAFAADPNQSFTAPKNGQSYTFSVPLQVNETEPYAGIQFKLALSSEEHLSYTFSMGSDVTAKGATQYAPTANTNYFGFWCGSNALSGNLLVGTLNIAYTGNDPQAIYITEMTIVWVDESINHPTSDTTKQSPVQTISVSRAGSETFHTVIYDLAGGTRVGGGELVQTVPDGGAAVAPTVSRSGYTFNGWDRSFANVTSDITVTAQWTSNGSPGVQIPGGFTSEAIEDANPPLANPKTKSEYFDDMDEHPWAIEEVDYLYEAGVVNGTSHRKFSPAANIKRGDFMLMLVRAFDLEGDFTENFSDVPPDSHYYDAIGIAEKLGIAKGIGNNTFAPEAPITRQDMMTLVDRTLRAIDQPLPAGTDADLSPFPDKDIVAGYAKDPVATLIKSGIVRGAGSGLINPLGNTTRAEMAVVMYRLLTLE
ncbi:MAG: S-layer homology domain-containing protein [Oscillospiraceae bacterium]|nr:S-layer homology domain-containing protein [Oscillospiraceae bacterium]